MEGNRLRLARGSRFVLGMVCQTMALQPGPQKKGEYRMGMSVDDAVSELRRCAGTQFDPACVAAFERALERQSFPRPDWSVQRPPRLQIVA